MTPTETRYANAIRAYIETDLNTYETAAVYDHLRHDFKLTDEEIADLGYDFLVPAQDETEPKEEPLRSYDVNCAFYLRYCFTVEAHNQAEAEEIASDELMNVSYDDMFCETSDYSVTETF